MPKWRADACTEWEDRELLSLTGERDACGVGFIASQTGESSRRIVTYALNALRCMEHRGGCSADYDSGDGAGLMTAIPWKVIVDGLDLDQSGGPPRGLGMIFLPPDAAEAASARALFEEAVIAQGLTVAAWRVVPVDNAQLGVLAARTVPRIEQLVIGADPSILPEQLEARLYEARRRAERTVLTAAKEGSWQGEPYIASFSGRTVVYKGMVRSAVLDAFYLDLRREDYASRLAIYHRRFSTNTMPRWSLAQPMRVLGHNGEINTLLGNLNWMRAREREIVSASSDAAHSPLVDRARSDSANLDGAAELLARQPGRDLPEALMVLVPEAFESNRELDGPKWAGVSDFYKYHALLQEAWDGPALLVFSDGKWIGATLDRNGLRPARYLRTSDGLVCMMSETGVVPVPAETIVEKGRLGPGQMIAVELSSGHFFHNHEIKPKVAARADYAAMLATQARAVEPQPFAARATMSEPELVLSWTAFGWSLEDVGMGVADMASTGKESTFCMGDDAPLATLSEQPHMVYDYLKQRFAQVTNPPIDPIREGLVMSLAVSLGRKDNVLAGGREHLAKSAEARGKPTQLTLRTPLLNDAELALIEANEQMAPRRLSTRFPADLPGGLGAAIDRLRAQAAAAVEEGAHVLILSDKPDGSSGPAAVASELFIPPLLAVGAVHHDLLGQSLRMRASLVVQTGQAWSTHHLACLIGYGASAVHPYLAYESVLNWFNAPKTVTARKAGSLSAVPSEEAALANYRESVEGGLLKILSKIGISLLESYHGAQIFEAIGLSEDVVSLSLRGTPSRLGGMSLAELEEEGRMFHRKAFGDAAAPTKLENYGFVKYYTGKEHHHNSPPLTKLLHKALEAAARGDAYDQYALFAQSVRDKSPTCLRDLLEFRSDRQPIALDEVEPASEIMRTFCSGAMSLGALSREAHETIAVAMNRIGGKSNSGEGGEDPLRFSPITDVDEVTGVSASFPHLHGLRNGDLASSAVKQVASGRFGVTAGYLANAQQLEIKMGQGAKPGEGGQLPGTKVDAYIARLRNAKQGITLISPPPHHDIYSIEDLAQLIYDLHEVNTRAQVSVKLVAEVGIGTVAAGVAKANADVIQISGHDGGTGASPLSSIKHAGSPWELGLAEAHQTLAQNGLRERVTLRVDGGLKTGYDVVQAAMLGADEYGFGTIVMIAEGCIMARICHTNRCPVGVTTQDEALRKRFSGTPADIASFFELVAQEVRHTLAALGYTSLRDVVGRADLLARRAETAALPKTRGLDLSFLTAPAGGKVSRTIKSTPHANGAVLDDELLVDSRVRAVLESNGGSAKLSADIRNTDRTVGARLAGEIARRYGDKGFGGQIEVNFRGSAGQSFGAFNLGGVRLTIEGEANDYVAKGMHGGAIVIKPPSAAQFTPTDSAIIGNTCLYGATGGELFANGRAGERFAVRNSGARVRAVPPRGRARARALAGPVPTARRPCANRSPALCQPLAAVRAPTPRDAQAPRR